MEEYLRWLTNIVARSKGGHIQPLYGIGQVIIHAAYVVAETVVLCFVAIQSQYDALQSAELRVQVAALRGDAGAIDLRQAPLVAQSASARALGSNKTMCSWMSNEKIDAMLEELKK